MALTGYAHRYALRSRVIDEVLGDIDAFRERTSAACGAFSLENRQYVARINESETKNASLLDTLHDSLLPSLRRMATKTKSKELLGIVGESYLLEKDEVTLIMQRLLEKRTDQLIEDFIESQAGKVESTQVINFRDNAYKLLRNKSATDLTDLYMAYIDYEVYTNVAQHCLVSYIDPLSPSKSQRRAKKRIAREQATYAESLRERHWNVNYRVSQISNIYDGLIDVIVENNWNIDTLVSIRQAYDALSTHESTRTQKHTLDVQAFTKATNAFVTSEATKLTRKDEPSLRACVNARHSVESHLAHLLNLSPLQFSHLPALVAEFIELLVEQNKINKRA